MIKDLITKLMEEANSEAAHRMYPYLALFI